MIETHQPEVRLNLTSVKKPVHIVDVKEQNLRRQVIRYVKVQWTNQTEREATWKLEEEMKAKYPELFMDPGKLSRTKVLFRRGEL